MYAKERGGSQCKMKGHQREDSKTWRRGFQACDFTDETRYRGRLQQHKEQEGHKQITVVNLCLLFG